jgi:hypothetical protein
MAKLLVVALLAMLAGAGAALAIYDYLDEMPHKSAPTAR